MKKLLLPLLALTLASCASDGSVREAQRWNVWRCTPLGPVAGAASPHGDNAANAVNDARSQTKQQVTAMGGDTVVWDDGSGASGQAFKCRQ